MDDDFDRLQAALPDALAANVPGSGRAHAVVAMASYSLSDSLLQHYGPRIPAMEHRYLNATLLLTRIDCDFVFVCSLAPDPEVLAYYRTLVPPDVADRMRDRVHCIAVDDETTRSLAEKLLDRPDLLDEIRGIVGDRPALIEPWNVTENEVAVALALGLPINGTAPVLRSEAFKSAGRRLFHRSGVPVPLGREDVHTVDDVAAAAEWIRASRPSVGAVVIKHDDSGAGDGNLVLDLRDDSGAPRDPHEVLASVAALPAWFLDDLAAGGGVVEEMVVGEQLRSPSVQVDLLPGGGVRVVATHDQVLGGNNGQVYLGCRFPADPAYAADLARFGTAVGGELAARGCVGRAGVDFMAARSAGSPWSLSALEVNLRKGGTTHPFAALRSLVPGHYDADAGAWLADADSSTRAYRSTDNFVDPSLAERTPLSVIDAVRDAGLQFDAARGTGVVLHMLGCLAVDGRFGATAIGRSQAQAEELYAATWAAVAGTA
jgi:PGM1 C-terminal domain